MEQERKDMAEVIKKDFAKQIDNLNKENENLTDKINTLMIKHRNEIIRNVLERVSLQYRASGDNELFIKYISS